MKIKEGFILKNIAGSFVVIPVGNQLVDFREMMSLNETGAFLWEKLQNDTTIENLVTDLTAEYEVSADEALSDIKEFVNFLDEKKVLNN